jgi:hypothetical protein
LSPGRSLGAADADGEPEGAALGEALAEASGQSPCGLFGLCRRQWRPGGSSPGRDVGDAETLGELLGSVEGDADGLLPRPLSLLAAATLPSTRLETSPAMTMSLRTI